MGNISDKSFRENQNTHFIFHNFFFKSAIYEIMWKNIVEHGRPQMTIWHTHIACWVPKDTNTHSEYVIIITFPLQQWLHGHTSMLRYSYIACLVEYILVHNAVEHPFEHPA